MIKSKEIDKYITKKFSKGMSDYFSGLIMPVCKTDQGQQAIVKFYKGVKSAICKLENDSRRL